MKKRESKTIIIGITSDQYEENFATYAKSDAEIQKLTASMDVRITAIRESYSPRLAELNDTKTRAFEVVQTYATENRDVLFSRRKSIENAHGTFGFRTGTPKLKTLKGFTWASVGNMLKEFLPSYVRITEEPAKDKLLADRDKPEVSEQFAKCGFSVVQDESFFVELKKEDASGETLAVTL